MKGQLNENVKAAKLMLKDLSITRRFKSYKENEKAYDRIEWGFVTDMLKAFGFPEIYCNWINVLFKDASTVIDVNGCLSEPIVLERSIRQGCLIASLLFVIAADALFYILRAKELGPPLKGISLPNGEVLHNAQFADDTSLFLGLSEENFEIACKRISFFCVASGSKIAP